MAYSDRNLTGPGPGQDRIGFHNITWKFSTLQLELYLYLCPYCGIICSRSRPRSSSVWISINIARAQCELSAPYHNQDLRTERCWFSECQVTLLTKIVSIGNRSTNFSATTKFKLLHRNGAEITKCSVAKTELSNIAIGEQVNIWMPDNILTKSSFCPIYNKTMQENKMTTVDILRWIPGHISQYRNSYSQKRLKDFCV